MVFGTFDILHQGHINFFKQARKLSANPFLIVSIARDDNVKKIKGQKPKNNERKRLSAIKKYVLVNKVVLGGAKNYLKHILKEKPQVIVLGYDQKAYTRNLRKLLNKQGLKVRVVRARPFKPHLYKSSLLKNS